MRSTTSGSSVSAGWPFFVTFAGLQRFSDSSKGTTYLAFWSASEDHALKELSGPDGAARGRTSSRR